MNGCVYEGILGDETLYSKVNLREKLLNENKVKENNVNLKW